jgi:L-seryl-tRNA(Ser) seleniumtransferase
MTEASGFRALPPVHALLADPHLAPWVARWGRRRVRAVVAEELRRWRVRIREGAAPPSPTVLAAALAEAVARAARPRLRRVVNATGVVLHTGLGRAPLAPEAVAALGEAAGYCNLELDLDTGTRGDRSDLVQGLLRELVGAEAALVVNNNAGAVLLALAALARGREVVVARGELVEIGGGFRLPEVLAESGARLREVGTTNRTHLRDYEEAVGPETALLLRVHQSNFRMVGFTAQPSVSALADLARRRGLVLLCDLGSGHLDGAVRLPPGAEEPGVRATLAEGADLVAFSGDKLLGGPQAGVLVGRADLVRRLARHPLYRALRVDKLILAALAATLELYAAGRPGDVPAVAMLARGPEELAARAEALARALRTALGERAAVAVRPESSAAGGGALAAVDLPTRVVAVAPRGPSAQALHASLRRGEPPVVARVRGDELLLDPRTLTDADLEALPALVAAAFADAAEEAG